MVFDLIVEAAHEDRHETSAADVATHQDLAPQEVQLQPRRDQRHADVVRRERRAQVEAEDGQLDGEEGDGLARRQHQEHESDKAADANGQHGELNPSALDLAAAQAARNPSECSERPSSIRIGKKYQPWWDTSHVINRLRRRVACSGVMAMAPKATSGSDRPCSGCMVSVVLVPPPAVADAHEQVRDDHAGPVVPSAGLEDLAVGCVVAEEPQLGHDDREHALEQFATSYRRSR